MDDGDVLNSMCALPGARNVRVGFFGSFMRVAFDASQDYGPSSSGRTRSIASSCGNRSLGTSGLAVCLNAWYKEEQPANLELLAKGLSNYQGSNIKGVCQGKFAIFTVDLTVDGTPGFGARVLRTIATTNGNRPIGESNVSVLLLLYVTQGKKLDLSGLPTTTSLSVGPWPGPNWVVTLEERVVLISVDCSRVNEGRLQFKEKIPNKGKKANIIAEHGSFPLVLGDAGVNLTFQISMHDDSIKIMEERKEWVPIVASKKDGTVQKGVFYRCCEGKLLFKLDPEGNFGISTSGLSSVVATTGGRVSIPGTNMLSMINAFRKIQGAQRSEESKESELKKRKARAKSLAIERKAKRSGVKKKVAAEEILTAMAQKIRQVAKSGKRAKPLADTNGKTKADEVRKEEDDNASVTMLKGPLAPPKGASEPLAKKARPAEKKTNGKKDSAIKNGTAMNHANVTSAVKVLSGASRGGNVVEGLC